MKTTRDIAISKAIIKLMNGVVYRESDEATWRDLDQYEGAVQDHFEKIGVRAQIDRSEGYAFLRAIAAEDDEEELPRLVKRHSYSFSDSLLLILLRKRLFEFEAGGGEGRLVLEREQIVDMMRVFLKDTSHEVRLVRDIEQTVNRVAKHGFLREMKAAEGERKWEVKRIIKAYVDAAALAGFEAKMAEYAADLGTEVASEGQDE